MHASCTCAPSLDVVSRVTAGCLALALVTWLSAFHVAPLHELDARVLQQLNRLDGTVAEDVVELLSSAIDPIFYALLCLLVLGLGARAAGARAAIVAGLAMLGANVTTQVLKRGLAEPRHSDLLERQVDAASWPSGHATAATIVLLAALMLAPRRLRPLVLTVGGGWAAVVCVGVVINHWHYPSDVLGGLAVAGAWASAAYGLLSLRRPARAARAVRRRRWQRATG